MWVKICGNTNLDDAMMAAELGADALGFVFAPSKRQVTVEQVARIVERLPPGVETVGVFPAWDAERIASAVRVSGVTTCQLHGGYNPALTASLREYTNGGVQIIEVIHWEAGIGLTGTMPPEGRVLVDSKVGAETGGTGKAFPWEAARQLFISRGHLILAGGLRPENVGLSIKTLQPWGLDVASGVELSPGRKDLAKVTKFLEEIQRSEDAVPHKPAT